MMMTKRKTSLLALGATATLMALAPTAVNADAYGNAAHSCEYLNKIKECALLGTEATCGTDTTNCLWITEDGDSFCGTTTAVQENFVTATVPPTDHAEVVAGTALGVECALKAEADCTDSCEWMTSPSARCGLSEAGVKSKITNSLGALNLYRQLKCQEYTSEADCNTNTAECEWDTTCRANVSVEEYLEACDISLSPASRLTKVSAVVSAVFVAALASLA